MSKTSQRKVSAGKLGYNDCLESNGELFRWGKHPFLAQYRAAWNRGRIHLKYGKADKVKRRLFANPFRIFSAK